MLRSAPPLRRGALLIRGRTNGTVECFRWNGPGSAKRHCVPHRARDTTTIKPAAAATTTNVVTALDPVTHLLSQDGWMAGSSPAMTTHNKTPRRRCCAALVSMTND
jgi:hypothetical protein